MAVVKDTFLLVCDGLKGLPDSVFAASPLAIIHLIRNPLRSTKAIDSRRRTLIPKKENPTNAT